MAPVRVLVYADESRSVLQKRFEEFSQLVNDLTTELVNFRHLDIGQKISVDLVSLEIFCARLKLCLADTLQTRIPFS